MCILNVDYGVWSCLSCQSMHLKQVKKKKKNSSWSLSLKFTIGQSSLLSSWNNLFSIVSVLD